MNSGTAEGTENADSQNLKDHFDSQGKYEWFGESLLFGRHTCGSCEDVTCPQTLPKSRKPLHFTSILPRQENWNAYAPIYSPILHLRAVILTDLSHFEFWALSEFLKPLEIKQPLYTQQNVEIRQGYNRITWMTKKGWRIKELSAWPLLSDSPWDCFSWLIGKWLEFPSVQQLGIRQLGSRELRNSRRDRKWRRKTTFDSKSRCLRYV